jgi:hypothetical protein
VLFRWKRGRICGLGKDQEVEGMNEDVSLGAFSE